MSLHHQERSHFRLSTLEDIKYLAPRLRQEDKQEILAGSGLIPYYALLNGFQNSVSKKCASFFHNIMSDFDRVG